jgi:hypothetical protein
MHNSFGPLQDGSFGLRHESNEFHRAGASSMVWRFGMLQRERTRKVRLGIEPEADALLSISGAQAYSIALKRADEVSSDQMAHDWSVVAATVARKSGVRSSLLDALLG